MQTPKILLTGLIILGCAVFVFSAARATEAEQVLTTESAVLSGEPEALEGVQVPEPKSVPSSFGLWWRNVREGITIALTLDPVKKAEKQLVFAEERVKLADYIAQNSTDPKVQDKAQQVLAKANEYMQKIEAKTDGLVNSADPNAQTLLQNIARHQVNQTLVLDKLEDKLPPEKLEQFQQFRDQIETQGENVLQNLQNNPNIPPAVKDKVVQVAAQVEAKMQERQELRIEQKDLLDQIKAGNEQAKADFETLRQDRQRQVQQVRQDFKAQRDEIINQIKENNSQAANDLKQLIQEKTQVIQGINQEVKTKAQEIKQGIVPPQLRQAPPQINGNNPPKPAPVNGQ